MAVLAILISLLQPSISKAHQAAVDLRCLNQLSNMGRGSMAYREDFNNHIPISGFINGPGQAGLENIIPHHIQQTASTMFIRAQDSEDHHEVKDFLVPEPLAISFYENQKFIESFEDLERSKTGENSTTVEVGNILEKKELFRDFFCPAEEVEHEERGNWLVGMGVSNPSISNRINRSWGSYGTNQGVSGLMRQGLPQRTAEGKVQRIGSPSATMLLADVAKPDPNKVSWSILQALDYGTAKFPEGKGLDDVFAYYSDLPENLNRIDMERHLFAINILFVDGHVSKVPFEEWGEVLMNKNISEY